LVRRTLIAAVFGVNAGLPRSQAIGAFTRVLDTLWRRPGAAIPRYPRRLLAALATAGRRRAKRRAFAADIKVPAPPNGAREEPARFYWGIRAGRLL
jgi:hypothetical protein